MLDALAGRTEEARKGVQVAMRLDRKCYSAALAQVLLSSAAGDSATAERIFQRAMNEPIGDSGRTIAQAMTRMGMAGA